MQTEKFLDEFKPIFSSLERMAKGTCASDINEICTWELMPKIYAALTEHIALEEKDVFPHLSTDEREQHKLEHERLLRILSKASYEFECGYGEQLSVIVRQLSQALSDHLEKLTFNKVHFI